jgi:hypothetical protein
VLEFTRLSRLYFREYIELVDIAGKCVREDKADHINQNQPNHGK